MKADLLITTYNRPEALEAVFMSIGRQTVMPHKIIVADDGSGAETATLIKKYQSIFDMELVHAWQEDQGFRAAESRNNGLAHVESPYVIIIDGDMLLGKYFIQDHLYFAERGHFIQGGRVMLTEEKTRELLQVLDAKRTFQYLEKGVESRLEKKITAFRSILLAALTQQKLVNKRKVRSCNMSFFMEDILRVNGFNNEFVGWGREDSEFVERLNNAGVQGKLLKFTLLAYHLYHKEETRASLPQNDELLNKTIATKLVRCEDGLSKFLK